ncbi:hypothetical protein pVco7_gp048 [Vibrio phage pVco-7]|uniref:Uncharacterized protein n=1 Tax=Vibrio phage pVco-5 TaxID=1965485 RepID=A0A1W6JUV6_9CAUD|nr:hypothetical protein KNT61_gp049 [Vibrio phage pVco-5]ARM71037.1 hypothetical protein pVco5_049 [Vibrio phage pVco-5]
MRVISTYANPEAVRLFNAAFRYKDTVYRARTNVLHEYVDISVPRFLVAVESGNLVPSKDRTKKLSMFL